MSATKPEAATLTDTANALNDGWEERHETCYCAAYASPHTYSDVRCQGRAWIR